VTVAKAKKAPAFQFYVHDWLTGTKALTYAEKGLYVDMLATSWDIGPLPAAVPALAREMHTPLADFVKLWRTLRRKFRRVRRGNRVCLINPRLERVRREREMYLKKQRENGGKGGRPRKPTGKPTGSEVGNPTGNPTPNPKKPLQSSVFDLHQEIKTIDQDPREDARGVPVHGVLTKLAEDVLQDIGADAPDSELIDELKTRAAKARLVYDGRSATKAIDSARAKALRLAAS